MLVIRRRAGESLLISDNIEIEILELGPTHVKLGIRAPRQIAVWRKEVQVTAEQNRAAALGHFSISAVTTQLSAVSAQQSGSSVMPRKAEG
jgi:carbon storage regulator